MTAASNILLLADGPLAERITRPLPRDVLATRGEPFAALEELAKGDYRVVLVACPQPGLGKLLEAVGRVRPAARVFGLCFPSGEPEVRGLRAGLLEDYFIVPPTEGEWRRIQQASGGLAEPAEEPGGLPAEHLRRLIEASVDLSELCACLSRLAGEVCRAEVKWSSADRPGEAGHELLRVEQEGSSPRILWSLEQAGPGEAEGRWLAAVRAILPSLASAARRGSMLHRLAITDDLTGAYNRRYFMQFGEQLLQRARQRRFRVTLLVYDIDDFKRYNDHFGHAAGDEILRDTAAMMKQITRKHDVVARIGGDEFAVLFWDTGPTRQPNSQPLQTAYQLADRFRRAVTSHAFEALGPQASGSLTISGGLATFPWDGWTIDHLLLRADEALLAAKANGKNNIHLVGGE